MKGFETETMDWTPKCVIGLFLTGLRNNTRTLYFKKPRPSQSETKFIQLGCRLKMLKNP